MPSESAVATVKSGSRLRPYFETPDGAVKLYHGDSRELVPALIADGLVVDHLMSDPPYSPRTHAKARGDGGKSQGVELVTFASTTVEEISDVLAAAQVRRWAVFTADWRHMLPLEENPPAGLKFLRFGVWVKPNGAPQFTGDRPAQGWEGVAILHRSPAAPSWNAGGDRGYWIYNIAQGEHPTQKPIELLRRWVTDFTSPRDLILDPWAGVSTTARAAMDLGRRCISIEIDEKWCEFGANRLRQQVLL